MLQRILKSFAFVAAATAASISTAMAEIDHDAQAWVAAFANGPVSSDGRFLVWFDAHARFDDDISGLGTSIIRPGIGWRVNDKLSVWAGYGRIVGRRDGRPNTEEDRIWQQATYPVGKPFGGSLSGRTRLEQRFLNTGDETGWRLRQFMRFAKPIGDTPFSFVLGNETFIALNDTDFGARGGFDQTRTFIGGAHQVTDNVRFELGYLNVFLNRPEGVDDGLAHAVAFNTFFRF